MGLNIRTSLLRVRTTKRGYQVNPSTQLLHGPRSIVSNLFGPLPQATQGDRPRSQPNRPTGTSGLLISAETGVSWQSHLPFKMTRDEILAARQPSPWRAGRLPEDDSHTEPWGSGKPRDHDCHMTWELSRLSRAGTLRGLPGSPLFFPAGRGRRRPGLSPGRST